MAREWAKSFYRGKGWLKCRASYIAYRVSVDGGLCEQCKKEQGYIVHHKVLLTEANINIPDISLNHNHLEYVCKGCHDNEEGHFKQFRKKKSTPTREGYKFNDRGELVPVLPP